MGEKTLAQPLTTGNAPVPLSALIKGVRPNEAFYFRLVVRDEHVQAPEQLTSETVSYTTPIVPPKIIGEPKVSFIKPVSAVMSGELNPENAKTEYFFEYAQDQQAFEKCPGVRQAPILCTGVATTSTLTSSIYGVIGATLETSGLQSAKTYLTRMSAESKNKNETEKAASTGGQSTFDTPPTPSVEAATGPASAITTTSAVLSGAVNPGGQPATYTFELGANNGTATQYAVVLSGSVEATTTPVQENLTLPGLQPNTTYAYRIAIHSGYGTAQGNPVTFTTTAEPAAIVRPTTPPMLAIPKEITFPKPPKPTTKCKQNHTRNKHNKCVKTKKTKKHRKTTRKK